MEAATTQHNNDTHAQRRHWAQWVAWPVWATVCFLLAFLIGGIAYSILYVLFPGVFQDAALGNFIISTLVYLVLIGLLVSIARIKGVIAFRRLPALGTVGLPIAIMAGAFMVLFAHIISLGLFVIVASIAGLLFVFSHLRPHERTGTLAQYGIGRSVRWGDIGLGFAGYVVYFVIFIVATMVLTKIIPAYNSAQSQNLGFTSLAGIDRLVGFVVLVVVTPLAEEFIMRGFLFGKLRAAKMPFWPAALVVSVMFGLAHGQWNVGIDTFILSMVACYLREATGVIWPGVIIHMTKNAIAYVALFILMVK